MLVLSRKPQETIVIDSTMLKSGQPIFIRVLEVKNSGKTRYEKYLNKIG